MSFRKAYASLKTGRRASRPQGLLRDPTPEEWKRKMDEYYIQQRKLKEKNK